MAVAVEEQSLRKLTFGRNGSDPTEWFERSTYPGYTDDQKVTFLQLYIRTHRHDLHPILLESLQLSLLMLRDDLLAPAEEKIKGKGPRGRHAPKVCDE